MKINNKIHFLYWVWLLSFVAISARCQQPFIQHYPMDVYRGAIQNWGFDQDSHGTIYVANNDGLLSFDGISWDLTSLPDKDFVYALSIGDDDKIYVGSYNEFGYFSKDSLGKLKYQSLIPMVPPKFQNEIKYIDLVKVFGNEVFFMGDSHVFVYSDGGIKVHDVAGDGLLKVESGLYLLLGDEFYEYKSDHFEAASFNADLESLKIRFIDEIKKNSFLIFDDRNRLWKFEINAAEGNKLDRLSWEIKEHFEDLSVLKIYCLDNGHVLFTSRHKMVILNENGKLLQTIYSEPFGDDFSFSSFYEDTHHNLWVSTNSLISQIITSSPISYYHKPNGLRGTVISLGSRGQDQYVGTSKGVFYKESKGEFVIFPGTEGVVWNFFNFRQKLYATHSTGVLELDGKQVKRVISHPGVYSLCEIKDRPDRLLMGTDGRGVWLLEKTGNQWHKKKIRGFDEEIRYIQRDEKGDIWVSQYNQGIFRLRVNEQMDSVVHVDFYSQDHGLPSHLNNRVYRLNGKIVVATVNGIYSFNYKKGAFEPEKEYNDALGEGLCIYTLTETPDGNIYFWGGMPGGKESAGMLIKQPDGSFKLSTIPFEKISIPTRDLRIDVDAPLLAANRHEIWIGHNRKILTYNPAQKVFYDEPIHTFIKNVRIKDSLLFKNGMKLSTNDLSSDNNNLKFEFSSSFYEDADKNEFQYKLIGFDDAWSGWSTTHEAVFTNLPNGDHTFLVRTRNLYGNTSQPASFCFHIIPPWYKTWWAVLLQISVVFLILNTFMILKNRRIRRQKLTLERRVHEKTVELKQKNQELLEKNSEIIIQAEKLRELNSTKDKLFSVISHDLRGPVRQIGEVLKLIEKSHVSPNELGMLVPGLNENVRYTIDLMDNLLYWAKSQLNGMQFRPVLFDIKDLAGENHQLLKLTASRKGVDLINEVSDDFPVYADKDMITLVLRNLVSNAIKFTDKGGEIKVSANKTVKDVCISVEDTGTGMSDDEISNILNKEHFTKYGTSGEKGTGLGLMLCKEFVKKNGGIFSVKSEEGKGSKFSFSIPQRQK